MDFCRYEKKDRVAYITITRPEVMNALHVYANLELNGVWDDFAADDDLWVAVFTGEGGRAFSAGNDLKFTAEMSRLPASERPDAFAWPGTGFGGLTSRFNLYQTAHRAGERLRPRRRLRDGPRLRHHRRRRARPLRPHRAQGRSYRRRQWVSTASPARAPSRPSWDTCSPVAT